MIRKSLIYGFVILMAILASLVIVNANNDSVKYVEFNGDNFRNFVAGELEKGWESDMCAIQIIPYNSSGGPQAQFPLTKTIGAFFKFEQCNTNGYVVSSYNFDSEFFKQFLESAQKDAIIIPVVKECGVAQTSAFGCTKEFVVVQYLKK